MDSTQPTLSPSEFKGVDEPRPHQEENVQFHGHELSPGVAAKHLVATDGASVVAARPLPEYRIGKAEEVAIPEVCPEWFKRYDKTVFRSLLKMYNVFVDGKSTMCKLVNGTSPHYNHLIVILMTLDKACQKGDISPEHQREIAGWLDDLLENLPTDWRDLPLVINPAVGRWALPEWCKELAGELDQNREAYLKSIGKESFVAPWLCNKVINSLDLGSIYLAYYTIRNNNITSVSGSPSLTPDGLFAKDPVLYDWLVMFRDKEKIQQNFDISDIEYNAMVEMLSSVDGMIARTPGLKGKNRFKWNQLAVKPGMEQRWDVIDSGSGSESSSSIPDSLPVSIPVDPHSVSESQTGLRAIPREKTSSACTLTVHKVEVPQPGMESQLRLSPKNLKLETDDSDNPYAKKRPDGTWRDLKEGEVYREFYDGLGHKVTTGIIEPINDLEAAVARGRDYYKTSPAEPPSQMNLPDEAYQVDVPGEVLRGVGLAGENDLVQPHGQRSADPGSIIKHDQLYTIGGAQLAMVIENVLVNLISPEHEELDRSDIRHRLSRVDECLKGLIQQLNNIQLHYDRFADDLSQKSQMSDAEEMTYKQVMERTMICQAAAGDLRRLHKQVSDVRKVAVDGVELEEENDSEDEVSHSLKAFVKGHTSWNSFENIKRAFDYKYHQPVSDKMPYPDPILLGDDVLPSWCNKSHLPCDPEVEEAYRIDHKEAIKLLANCLPRLVRQYSHSTNVWSTEAARRELGAMVHLLEYLESLNCVRRMQQDCVSAQPYHFSQDEEGCDIYVPDKLPEEHVLLRQALALQGIKAPLEKLIQKLETPDYSDAADELKKALRTLNPTLNEILGKTPKSAKKQEQR